MFGGFPSLWILLVGVWQTFGVCAGLSGFFSVNYFLVLNLIVGLHRQLISKVTNYSSGSENTNGYLTSEFQSLVNMKYLPKTEMK